jgi:hypothetical protein
MPKRGVGPPQPVIAAVLAGGDPDAVPSDTRQACRIDAGAVLSGPRAAGWSIVRTSSLR